MNLPKHQYRLSKDVRKDTCKDCERIKCAACKQEKPNASFDDSTARDVWNNGRQGVCKACKEQGCSNGNPNMYKCTGPCQEEKGHNMFDAEQLTNFKIHGRRVLVCKECKKDEPARERRLRKLLKESKRARCKCGSKLQHSERCPMFPRFLSEIPYPGCDVISREESEWLEKRSSRK